MAKNQLPNPINKDVIILAGEFAGQEGYCLGQSDQAGVFAVTPLASGGAVSDTGQRDGPNLILAIFLQKNGRPAS